MAAQPAVMHHSLELLSPQNETKFMGKQLMVGNSAGLFHVSNSQRNVFIPAAQVQTELQLFF